MPLDTNADPATAVSAFLDQFILGADGAITYDSGAALTETFHVKWLHYALQKKVWDFNSVGNDNMNLGMPNPSRSAALDTIITLEDHTTNFSVNYTITDEVATYLFGGSVSQNGGADEYYGLRIEGAVAAPMPIKAIQDGAVLTSHWGNGKNQTDANTLLRILVKGKTGGTVIDNGKIVVKLDTWGYGYSFWESQLGLGEAFATLSSSVDSQNDTALLTVQGYTITKSTGYQLISIDGGAARPFIGQWSRAPEASNKALYEFVKSLLVDGTAETLHGVSGALWTNRVYRVTLTPGAGAETWVDNETISWAGGTGHLMGVDDLNDNASTDMVLHLDTGLPPVTAETISGATAQNVVVSDAVKLAVNPSHLGQYTGAWLGAQGMGFVPGELTSADKAYDLDNVEVTPLDSRTISLAVEVGSALDDPHVFLALKHPTLDRPYYDMYTSTVAATAGASAVDVGEAIASDVPKTGWLGVLHTGDTQRTYYEYSDWNGQVYTLVGTLDSNIVLGDEAFWAFFYNSGTGAGTTKSFSRSFVFNAAFDVRGWARNGSPAAPDTPVPISATISGDYSATIQLADAA